MRIGVPKEVKKNEKRVAATLDTVAKLKKWVSKFASNRVQAVPLTIRMKLMSAAGAPLMRADSVWQNDLVLKVNPPQELENGVSRPIPKKMEILFLCGSDKTLRLWKASRRRT